MRRAANALPASSYSHAGAVVRLTAKERALLHLLEYVRYADAVEVPPEMTQEGVSRAAWFDVAHFTQYVRPLVKDGSLRERMAHVKGTRTRRKVYNLTESGRMQAIRLRERLRNEPVRVRDASGVRDVPLAKAVEEAHGRLTALEVFRLSQERGVVDLTVPLEAPSAFLEMTTDAPRVATFVGRKAELQMLTADEGPRLVMVLGMAGIGKSSLAAKACEQLRGTRNLFWHRVQPWDTVASLLADLGRFLGAIGRPGLGATLAKGGVDRAAQVLREDLPGTRSFLVFDDAHETRPDAIPFFRLLKEIVAQGVDVRAVVLTRRVLPFYDRRDVSVSRTVQELELVGLALEDILALLPAGGHEAAEVGRRLGGHPLFFDLVRSHPTASRALGDLRRFMEEQIYAELTEAQRTMMKLASLYRVAVPREALFCGPSLTHDVLLSVTERALIRHVGESHFVVHDTIRSFFSGLLTPTERRDLGAFALAQLRDLARACLAGSHAIAAMGSLANALELVSEEDRVELTEAFGDALERIGDLAGALETYGKARGLGPEPETIARLHRKAAAALEDRGDVAAAQGELDAALVALGETFTEERGWVNALQCLVARDTEEFEEASEYGEEALRTFRALGVPRGEARALLELGYVEYFSPDGDAAAAEEHVRSALAIASRLADPAFEAAARIALANVIGYGGRPQEGLEHLAAVEAMPAAMADPRVRRSCLEMKGLVMILLDPVAAEPIVTESMTLARKIRDSTAEAAGNIYLGLISQARLEFDQACSHFEAAARELRAQGFPGLALESQFYATMSDLLRGNLAGLHTTLKWLEEPSMFRAARARYPRSQQLRGLERLLHGDEAGVRAAFDAALRTARMPWVFDSHFLYGVALRVIGRDEESNAHLERARDLAHAYRWKWKLATFDEEARRLAAVFGCSGGSGQAKIGVGS